MYFDLSNPSGHRIDTHLKGFTMRPIGSQSMVNELNFVIVKHPRHSHVDQGNVDAQWQALNYLGRPDLGRVLAEFDEFVGLLNGFGMEIGSLPP